MIAYPVSDRLSLVLNGYNLANTFYYTNSYFTTPQENHVMLGSGPHLPAHRKLFSVMSTASPESHDLWRVAALSMMARDELSAALQGEGAATWVAAAAKCGFAEAQVRLGRMKLEGDGVARDAEAAFAWFQSAAESGDAAGHNMLGRCYENGWGTAKDYVQAAHHYRIASDAGLDWAHYNLGHMLLSGSGVARDRDAAFACYAKAAANGHVRAMNLVGRCYEEGWGVARDLEAARDCVSPFRVRRIFPRRL